MSVSLEIIDPLNYRDWDGLLLPLPGCSFFHCSAWAKVLGETYGYDRQYLASIAEGRISLLIPMMEIRSWLTGKRGVSLPFSDSCEPVRDNRPALAEALNVLLERGRHRRWKYCELRSGAYAGGDEPASARFHGHVLDLTPGESGLFPGLKGSTRTAIRKAQKAGVEVSACGTMHAVGEFYRLHCLTRKVHGLPPQPFVFFKKIHDHVMSHGLGFVVLATYAGKVVAAAVFFLFGTAAIFKYGASDPEHQSLRPSNMVMWKGIRECVEKGQTSLSMGRTSPANVGLRRFKSGWGAEEREITYLKYDFGRKSFVSSDSDVFGWHNTVFQKMPALVSRMAGKLLYRHIA